MDNITILEGNDLDRLLDSLLHSMKDGSLYTLRISQRPDGFTYKINSGCWSPTTGRRADAGGY